MAVTIYTTADDGSGVVKTYGTETNNVTYTRAINQQYYDIAPVAVNGISLYIVINVSTDVPAVLTVVGRYAQNTGTNHYAEIAAYDWATAGWDTLTTSGTRMNATSTETRYKYSLDPTHVGTGADVGKVHIRFTSPAVATADTLKLDYVAVSAVGSSTVFTPYEIATGVWNYVLSGHIHASAGFYIQRNCPYIGEVETITDTHTFVVSGIPAVDGLLNDYLVEFHDEGTDQYEQGIVKSYDSDGNVELYQDLSFTPSGDVGFYVLSRVPLSNLAGNTEVLDAISDLDTVVDGVSSAITTVDTITDAIKAQTDLLVFEGDRVRATTGSQPLSRGASVRNGGTNV